ncbi:MAG: SagB family peptide dehydrogenase [Rubrivivax sp.]|nr:SagB family peptide dehydrogenase [Rubrivivax sp.]
MSSKLHGMWKLLWVAAPLMLALVSMAWLAWRGRTPSRLGLNVAFSLLLLTYVLGTAALGIFWVANQQLPVFDWHYLFGYTTVLLLIVHLAFNWRVVWQFVRRKAGGAAAAAAATSRTPQSPAGRRPLLGFVGAGGLALAAGAGYLLGLRHGRTELRLAGAQATAGPGARAADAATATTTESILTSAAARSAAQAWAVVEQFHAHSGHSRSGVLRRATSTDWGLAPPPFKRYAEAQRLPLPKPPLQPPVAPGAPAAALPAPDLPTLAACLWLSAGISEHRGGIAFRTSPSSGALFATELYVLALQVHGLAPGLWHYDPQTHALHRLPAPAAPAGGAGPALAAFGPLSLPPRCLALIVATAIFARSGHKYGDRTYRYVAADLGHLLENLRVAARAVGGFEGHLLPRFDDLAIGRALGLDPAREGVLTLAALAPPHSAQGLRSTPELAGGWTSPVTDAFAAQGGRLGVTDAMQLATSLRAPTMPSHAQPATQPSTPPSLLSSSGSSSGPSAGLSATARPAETAWGATGSDRTMPLPPARPMQADWPQVIARRRSVRRFARTPVARQQLADILRAMTSPAPVLSAAVRVDLLSAAVEGLAPAAWRHDPATGGLLPRAVHGEALRRRARAAALDQDVIGDAAVVFVLSLDIAALRTDALGPARGYRHGFIEAGLVGERLYLAAGALGLAACAVGAFYDDEAAALVGIDPAREWVVHFAALGLPD